VAKIDVEHRKTTPPWIWIVVAVVALLVILGLWFALSDDNGIDDPFADEQVEEDRRDEEPPNEVRSFGDFVREGDDRHEIGREHEYSREGFHHLADAIDALADRRDAGDQFETQTDSIRARADRMQDDDEAAIHANLARQNATEGADAIQSLQQHHQGSGADVGAVRSAANNIDGQTPLLDQRDAVRNYFERAHRALDQMGRHRTQQDRTNGTGPGQQTQ
jgi:hypothetical protein